MDGTVSSGATLKAIHRHMEVSGREGQSRALMLKNLPLFMIKRYLGINLREHKNRWMREAMHVYAGSSRDALRAMTEFVIEKEIWPKRRSALIDEFEAHLAAGRRVIIVSGMPTPLLASLIERIPGVEAIGTPVVGNSHPFSGELGEFTVGQRKMEVLQDFADPDGLIHTAYGDTYSDLKMLSISRYPTAVTPDTKLRRAALEKNWRVLDL